MASIANLKAQRAELDLKIKAEQERTKEFTPTELLADMLHESLCKLNHTDECNWGYEKDWKTGNHARYHKIADNLIVNWDFVRQVKITDKDFAQTINDFLSLAKNL